MVSASQLRPGMAIRYQNNVYKVMSCEYHAGQGKMGGVAHAWMKNIGTGTFWEHGFRAEEKLEDVPLEKEPVDFLYSDADDAWFMNPITFEQFSVPLDVIGPAAKFLRPEMRVGVELFESKPVSVSLPEIVEARVMETADPVHTQGDNTWKAATLENDIEVMVPQFIRRGDAIRVDVNTGKYVERAKEKIAKG